MEVYNFIVYGLVAFIAGLISYLYTKYKDCTKNKSRAIFFISFFFFFSIAIIFIFPEIKVMEFISEIEQAENELPLLKSLKKYEPEKYNQITEKLKDAVRRDFTGSKITALTEELLQPVFLSKVSVASDQSIIKFVDNTVRIINELQNIDSDLAFQFLFPGIGQQSNKAYKISDSLKTELLIAMNDIYVSASENPQPPPNKEQALQLFEIVQLKLYQEFGDNVEILKNITDPEIDRDLVCSIAKTLYKIVLELPTVETSVVLRWMLQPEE